MSLLHYLLEPQMFVSEKTIIEEIKIQKIEDVAFTPVNKGEIQRPAHIVML